MSRKTKAEYQARSVHINKVLRARGERLMKEYYDRILAECRAEVERVFKDLSDEGSSPE